MLTLLCFLKALLHRSSCCQHVTNYHAPFGSFREHEVCFPSPRSVETKTIQEGVLVPRDRKDDKFKKSWKKGNLLVKGCHSMPGTSCKRWRDTPLQFSLLDTCDTAYATHGNLPSLKPICLYSSLNTIYSYTTRQVRPLWVFVLLWVQVGSTLQGEEEPPANPPGCTTDLLGLHGNIDI